MAQVLKDSGDSCDEVEIIIKKYAEIEKLDTTLSNFKNFPLSQKTLRGLQEAKYITPTEIQRASIVHALQGKDVLGSAITGSGKTLAFLIPVLEHLYLNKWSSVDGVGAIIISPTRELAYQTFETLKKIGKYHDFSAGLIIGGKNLKFERTRMDKCNILVCTPGRLLQHMDENPLFTTSNMEILVFDEADRCLDLGFQKTINAIIENLSPKRQTLLFSATQTNSIKDLARLSLKDPICVGLNKDNQVVPEMLQQSYVIVSLEDKLTMLWSFVKNHIKQKCIIFFASCKQVKYVYEIFCKLRPGTSLLALYGSLHQDRRLAIYDEFVKKKNVVLFATDIASRGLDFPSVNWVVQLDCPEDATQYIHRAGRSARNKERGESLLVLLPSEEISMLKELEDKGLTIKKIQIDPKKLFSPQAKVEAFLAQNPELKASAKRAFISYIKSVHNMTNKNIFNVCNLNFSAFAKSLGLAVTPRVRFLNNMMHNKIKEKVQLRDNSDLYNMEFKHENDNSESDSEELFTIKRSNHANEDEEIQSEPDLFHPKKQKLVTKAAQAKRSLKKNISLNTKHKFNHDGIKIKDARNEMQSELFQKYEKDDYNGGIDIEVSKKLILEEDKFDKERFREIVKIKHKSSKQKQKESSNIENLSDDSNSVDLSWLPSPDLLYNKETEVEQKSSISENSGKRLPHVTKSSSKNVKKRKAFPELSLVDAEKIATEILIDS